MDDLKAALALAWEAGRDAQRGKLSAVEPPADLTTALTARLDAGLAKAEQIAAYHADRNGIAADVLRDIRALRRAAPTEGEA